VIYGADKSLSRTDTIEIHVFSPVRSYTTGQRKSDRTVCLFSRSFIRSTHEQYTFLRNHTTHHAEPYTHTTSRTTRSFTHQTRQHVVPPGSSEIQHSVQHTIRLKPDACPAGRTSDGNANTHTTLYRSGDGHAHEPFSFPSSSRVRNVFRNRWGLFSARATYLSVTRSASSHLARRNTLRRSYATIRHINNCDCNV